MRFLFSFFTTVFLALFFAQLASGKIAPSDHYARMPAIYDAAISPDGKWMAAVVDNNGSYIVRVFNLTDPNDTKVRASGIGEKIKVNYIKWANNEQILVSLTQYHKDGSAVFAVGSLIVISKNMKEIRQVLRPKAKQHGPSRFNKEVSFRQFNNRVVDFLPDEPGHILMAFGKEDERAPGVHKVSLKSASTRKIKNGAFNVQDWTTDLRGEVRIGEGRNEESGDYHMSIRDAEGNGWHSPKKYPGIETTTTVFGFTKNPNELIIGANNGKDTLGLYVYDLIQKKQTRKLFHHDVYDVADVIKSPDGKKVVGAIYVGDAAEKVFFDPVYKARLEQIQSNLEGYHIRYLDQTPNGSKVLFKASTPSVPGILYVYDFSTNKMRNLGYDFPEIGKTLQGDVTKVRYTSRDGYKVPGYITTPPAIADGKVQFKNLPFVILPHGGPYARDTASFDYLAQFFVSRGYAVLQPNYRGSAGMGATHLEAGRNNWEVMQTDVEDGTRWLIKKGYADPKRICIVGWSYGGYAALMGAIKNPDLYTCSVSIAGLTDPKEHVYDMKKFRFGKHVAKSFILSGFEDRDDIKENSPVKRAGEIKTPVFLAHGSKDTQVNFNQYRLMKSALGRSSNNVYLEFKDGDHSLTNTAHRRELFSKLDKFVRKNLGESTAAP